MSENTKKVDIENTFSFGLALTFASVEPLTQEILSFGCQYELFVLLFPENLFVLKISKTPVVILF